MKLNIIALLNIIIFQNIFVNLQAVSRINSDLFSTFTPIYNHDISAIDETGILLSKYTFDNRYDCFSKCNSRQDCKMLSYKISQCKLYTQIKYSPGLTSISSPVLFERFFENYTLINSFLTTYLPFNGSFYDLAVNKLYRIYFYKLPTYTNDRFNQPKSALVLNNNYFYTYPYYSSINLLQITGYTISMWIKINSIGDHSKIFSIFDIRTEGLTLGLSNSTSGLPFIYTMSNSTPTTLISSVALNLYKWEHLAFTFDSKGLSRIYINGQITLEKSLILPRLEKISTTQYFGYMANDFYYRTNASLDDFKIFNKSLDQSEIRILLNS